MGGASAHDEILSRLTDTRTGVRRVALRDAAALATPAAFAALLRAALRETDPRALLVLCEALPAAARRLGKFSEARAVLERIAADSTVSAAARHAARLHADGLSTAASGGGPIGASGGKIDPDMPAAPTQEKTTDARPAAGDQRGLLGLQGMDAASIRSLLKAARAMGEGDPSPRPLEGRIVANLFFEDSTRTRMSFTVAAQRLGARVLDLLGSTSSVSKGETLIDTARNVESMGVGAIVVRARQSGAAEIVARHSSCPVVNAGDGRHEHPTQGLLDAYSLAEAMGRLDGFDLSGVRVAIVGDIVSSRVARSNIACLRTLGAQVVCIGPPALAPGSLRHLGCEVSHDLDSVLSEVDAVMMLRIQFERHDGGGGGGGGGGGAAEKKAPAIASIREYRAHYALTAERAARMKRTAVVMHPGPINRGIELDAAVADGPTSVILRQVERGVVVRMAVLARCFES